MKKTLAILAALALTGGAAMAERTNSITLNPDSTVAKKVNHVSSTPLTLVITVSDVDKASATLVVRNSSGAVKISTNAATVADDVYTFNLVAGNWTTNIFDSSKSIGDTETFWGDIYPLGYGAPLPAIKFSVRYGANTGSESYVDPTTGSWIAGGTTSSVINTVDMGTGAAISGSTLTLDEDLQDIAAIVPSNGLFLVGDGSDWVGESGSTARASMGLGSIATIDDAPSDGTTYGRKDGAWADAAAADTTYTNSLYADAPVTIAGTADGGSNRFGFAYNSGFTNAVRSAQTNVVDTDTQFTNTVNVGGFGLTLTGSATSGSNAINGVADSGFTNAVRSAQTNVVDTDTTFTNSLYADAPITVTGTAAGGSNRFGFVYNAAWSNEVQSAQTNPTLTSLGGQPTNANLSGWANISTNGGIDESNLDASVNASLDLADGSLQSDGSVALAGAQSIGNQTLNNLGILYDGNGTGAGINFSGMVVWDSGGNNSADFVDRKLIAEDGTTDILTWTNGLDVLDSSAQNIRDNAVATFDGTQNADEICVITANGITGKTGDELQMLTSGIYTQSFATNISYNMGYKIAGQLTVTNTVTFDVADAQPLHPFNFIIYGTNTVTMDSNLTLFGTWTQAATNVMSFTPKETGKWFYTVATP
jgi:hypothetical protein